jgi:hypothetical protein
MFAPYKENPNEVSFVFARLWDEVSVQNMDILRSNVFPSLNSLQQPGQHQKIPSQPLPCTSFLLRTLEHQPTYHSKTKLLAKQMKALLNKQKINHIRETINAMILYVSENT